ncbi:DUF4352 domain-containing protein [Halorussus gelatinilyticus]|uniref:DUF4352 domain-containing protein n=1 Tax=Halorussus gelatinilyticus TaxID=2937524 RepID=A0A8U0IFB5_9EURY|nr:DUF4352 domain-containing protein [Halorussus gelatinilyticus]UPV98983.1 DUF4352 domain-containing protein [Halorussus gelatinilyticus]
MKQSLTLVALLMTIDGMDGSDSSRRGILIGVGAALTGGFLLPHTESKASSKKFEEQTATTTTSQSRVPPGTTPSEIVPVGKRATVVSEDGSEQITYWIENGARFEYFRVGDERVTPDPGEEFLQVLVSAHNESQQGAIIDSDHFEVVTSSGQAYEPDEDLMLDFDDTFYIEDIDPQITKTRSVFFEIAPDKRPVWLKIGPGFADDGESVYFSLPDETGITTTTA